MITICNEWRNYTNLNPSLKPNKNKPNLKMSVKNENERWMSHVEKNIYTKVVSKLALLVS